MGKYRCGIAIKRRTAKLFDSDGNLQRLNLPVKAAELMLDSPGSVVCAVEEIRRDCRVSALRANDDLQEGKFYLMFPAQRVRSRVSAADMALIDAACLNKKMPCRPRALSPPAPDCEKGDGFPGRRNCRQWKPTLEPIFEVTRDSRILFL